MDDPTVGDSEDLLEENEREQVHLSSAMCLVPSIFSRDREQ